MVKVIVSTDKELIQLSQKVGIDTSILVNMTVKDINMFKFRENEFLPSDYLYYAMRMKYEFKGVILSKYGFDKKEKNKLWRRAKSTLRLKPIAIGNRDISQYLVRVGEANALLVKQRYNSKYKIGEADIEIIAHYLKWGISIVYTSDLAFHETCKILGLKSELISMSDYAEMKKRL